MREVTKATLTALDKKSKPIGQPISVQFNPSSLNIQMTNSTDGARSRGRQNQQYNGAASTTLRVDLEFDSTAAPSGLQASDSDTPVDVRKVTEEIRRFMRPSPGSEKAPQRVEFKWGTFQIQGVMNSLTEDITYFSPEGVPLHAKVTISINDQDIKFDAKLVGAGVPPARRAPVGGRNDRGEDAGPGSPGPPPRSTDASAQPLAGETAGDFLRRVDQPPEAWRAVSESLSDDFELTPGVPIDFPTDLLIPGGEAFSLGASAEVALDVSEVLGGGSIGLGAGFALSAAGGVSVGGQSAEQRRSRDEVDQVRSAFQVIESINNGPRLSRSRQETRSPDEGVDRRAVSFGAGIPLRERVSIPGRDGQARYADVSVRTPRAVVPEAQATTRAIAPWEQVPVTPARTASDAEQHRRTPACGCHRCDPWTRRRFGR